MAKNDENEGKGGGGGKTNVFDVATVIGFTVAMGLIIFGILSGTDEEGNFRIATENVASFWDAASAAIVIGGVTGCMLIMYPISQFAKIGKHMKIIILPKKFAAYDYIEIISECAKKARMNGLLSLEEDANSMTDPFLKSSIQMVVDSVDPETVQSQMEAWIDNVSQRHLQECTFYEKAAAIAPGMGMIGTLIGLINLMKNLSDIDAVGPNMSVALITTLYGSFLANVIFNPIATKLSVRHEEELLCMMVIYEGVRGIQAGESPTLIQQKLLSMLPEYKKNGGKKKGKGGDAEEPAE
ncbi:MAG: MotA/TolQ/ExbB proton channel family protein [Clostridia bacterium]